MAHTLTGFCPAVGAPAQELRLVTFALGAADFGVDVADVFGLYHGLPMIPRPDLEGFVAGEIQLADRRVPVVDLRRFAGLPAPSVTPRWIVVVNAGRSPVGFVVDKVTEVIRLAPRDLSPASAPVATPLADYLVAMARHRDRPLYLPDIGRLIHDAVS